MISLDEFYINYKIIVESAVKKLISESIQTALVSIYSDRGAYNASNDQFPSSGGSGSAGAIMAGDTWVIDADGSPGGFYLNIGDTIRAAVDNPTNNLADWTIINTGFGYTPLNKEGDTITGINGSGYLGLSKQSTDPSTPTNGIKLFSNNDGHLTYINEQGNVIDFDDVLSLLKQQSNGLLLVDMQNDDYVLNAEQSKNTIYILTNVGDGSKKLTLTDSSDVPSHLTFYVFDNNPVNISLSGNTFNKAVKPQTPLQVIYRTTASISLNYVTFNSLVTPGWATKVHFNEFGLIDNSSTISTADVSDSLNKRYVTDAEKQIIQDFIAAGGDAVPPTRMINGHTLENDITLTKTDLSLGNVDNTSDINKPISTATQAALDNKEDKTNKGIANGYVPLDNATKIPLTYLPDSVVGALKFKGFWNAATNICSSTDVGINGNPLPVADVDNEGWYFIISTAGTTEIDSIDDWKLNDWIVSIGNQWIKNNNSGSGDSFDHSTLQLKSEKGQANGYAPLNNSGKIDNIYLPPGNADFNFKEEFYEVKSIDVTNKYITLEESPIDDTRINLLVYGGTHQRPLIDFVVSDNILSWSGLALETLIDSGSYLYITYEY